MDTYNYPEPGKEPFNTPESEMRAAWDSKLKPIETRYRGYLCRSRLEARWMVFLDHLGIDFEYELEGFDLPNGQRYLPDLWLPKIKHWAEVKPAEFTAEERSKAVWLALASQCPILLLIGVPGFKVYDSLIPCYSKDDSGAVIEALGVMESTELLDIDYHCRRYYNQERRLYGNPGEDFSAPECFTPQYRDAVFASRSARFEGVKS